ncbi:MAG: hypothetical protein ACKO03_04340, partial [Bacteroidota bacterium]
FDDVRGCSNNKEIQPTKADISNRSFDRFLVIQPNEFVLEFNQSYLILFDKRIQIFKSCFIVIFLT